MSPEQYSVFVDLSAKIEAWDKPSIVVVANSHAHALRLPAYVKAALRSALAVGKEPPQYAILAGAVYLTLRPHLHSVKRIRLDKDYSGMVAERAISGRLLTLIRRDVPNFKGAELRFEKAAGTNADEYARQCYRGKRAIDGEITLAQMEEVIGVKR